VTTCGGSICEYWLTLCYSDTDRFHCVCVSTAAAIGARKPATARHNDAFVSRDHGQLSAHLVERWTCDQ